MKPICLGSYRYPLRRYPDLNTLTFECTDCSMQFTRAQLIKGRNGAIHTPEHSPKPKEQQS